MTIRSVALPLLSGAAFVLGYTAFAWLRGKPRARQAAASLPELVPLRAGVEHVPEALTVAPDDPAPSSDEAARLARSTHIRALFFARLTEALSPFHNPPVELAHAQGSR